MAARTRAIGRFGNAELIGRGGFGAVYRAEDVEHGRQVAIKVLPGNLDETERRRFDRERQTMGRLGSHPAIIPVHESGYTEAGEGYIVMELASGGSLRDRLDREGPIPWREAAEVAIAIAGAAQAAHDQGVLHRDIKPDNILIDGYGNPRLTDFGIAAVAGNATATTSTTATLAHAAPEVLEGQTSTAAVDVYAIGSTFANLVLGRPPFHLPEDVGVTPMIGRALTQPPPDLTAHGVPAAVAAVIARSLAKEAAGRQPSAAQLAAELRSALDGVALAGGGALAPAPVEPPAGRTQFAAPPAHHPGDPRLPTGGGPMAGPGTPAPPPAPGAAPVATAGVHSAPQGPGAPPDIHGAATTAADAGSTARHVPPQPPPQVAVAPAAAPRSSGGRGRGLLVFALLAVLAVVGGAVGAIVLSGGGDTASSTSTSTATPTSSSSSSSTTDPSPSTTPPPTATPSTPPPSNSTPSTAPTTPTTTTTAPPAQGACPVRIVDARTDRFDVMICDDGNGATEYVGRNRVQGVGIELPACFVGFGLFEARNEGFVYHVDTGTAELVVFDPAGTVIVREAFVGTPFVDFSPDFDLC